MLRHIFKYRQIRNHDENSEPQIRHPLDYEKQQNYTIKVQVFSGSLQTTESLTIRVVDVNDNPPILHDMHIIFNNFVTKDENKMPSLMEESDFGGSGTPLNGIIGKLNYFEPDEMDDVVFGQKGQAELLRVNETSGQLTIGPNLSANREFTAPISVTINDGLHLAGATVTIEVKIITPDALNSAVVLEIADTG
jgi:hypothetical protein